MEWTLKAGRGPEGQGPGAEATLPAPKTTTPVGIRRSRGGWMRRALPGGASELLQGFVSTGPGVGTGTGVVVPTARRRDGRAATSGARRMGGTHGDVVVG